MASYSKYCPKCGRIVTCNFVPNYCAWGCGSLAEYPILPDLNHKEERQKVIEEQKRLYTAKLLGINVLKEQKQEKIKNKQEIEPNKFQLSLFN